MLIHRFQHPFMPNHDKTRFFEDLVQRTMKGGFFFGSMWDANTALVTNASGMRSKRKRTSELKAKSPTRVRLNADTPKDMSMDESVMPTMVSIDRRIHSVKRSMASSSGLAEMSFSSGALQEAQQLLRGEEAFAAANHRRRIRPINHSTLSCSFVTKSPEPFFSASSSAMPHHLDDDDTDSLSNQLSDTRRLSQLCSPHFVSSRPAQKHRGSQQDYKTDIHDMQDGHQQQQHYAPQSQKSYEPDMMDCMDC